MKAINRRQFLAAGMAGALGLVSSAHGATDVSWNSRSTRSLKKFRDPIPTACAACDSHCAFTAHRYQGKVMGALPVKGGCARGLQMIEALYDPERLALPMRRVGERGSGEWEVISWDEAIAGIKTALKSSLRNVADLGRPDPVAGKMLSRVGFTDIVTEKSTRNWSSIKAREKVYGASNPLFLMEKAKTILLISAYPLDEGDDLAERMRELVAARKNGARIILVSPYQGRTGSFADQWIPIAPGSEVDFALALALALGKELPESAGELSKARPNGHTVDYDRLAALARRISEEGKTIFLTDSAGRGDALALESSVALLNHLGGAVENGLVTTRELPPWVPTISPTSSREGVLAEIGGHENVGVYLSYRANPLYESPDSEKAKAIFGNEKKIGLLVAMDTHLTETAMMADIVLPAAVDLECWNLLAAKGRIHLQQPVAIWDSETSYLRKEKVDTSWLFDGPPPSPLGEARQLGDMLLTLAGAKMTIASVMAKSLKQAEGILETGVAESWNYSPVAELDLSGATTIPSLKESDFESNVTLLPLRRAELDPAYPNSRWGRELVHENPLLINPLTAKKHGLRNKGKVSVTTPIGEFITSVLLIEGIHPDLVAIYDDFGHWGSGSTARATGETSLGDRIKLSRKDWIKQGLLSGKTPKGFKPWWLSSGPGISISKFTPLEIAASGVAVTREIAAAISPVKGS